MNRSQSAGKILIFSGVRGDTRRYRTLHLFEQLSIAGADCVISHLTDPRLPEYARAATVAILHRVASDRYVEKILNDLRARGALIVLDADDYLYDPSIMRWIDSPDFQDPIRASLYRKEIIRHRAGLAHCDGVTVSTRYLGDLVAQFGKPVWVHRNAYNREMLAASNQAVQLRERNPQRVVIGYASGTRTHDKDFAMIKPVLVDLMGRYLETELWLMGPIETDQDWGLLRDRVKSFPLVPWRELPRRLAMLDINLAPLLPNSPFNQAKSEIKWMEAGLVRVPTVASSTDAFRSAIQHGQSGFLASSLEEWQAALQELVESPAERHRVGKAAYQEIVTDYSPEKRGKAYLSILNELAVQLGRSHPFIIQTTCSSEDMPQASFFSAGHELHPTMAELASYSIRNRGLGTLLGQVWVYLRRKLAPIFPFRSGGVK